MQQKACSFVIIYSGWLNSKKLQIQNGMKRFNNAILRGIFAVLLGIILVLWPEAAIIYIIMVIGAGFLLPGVFSIVNYLMRNKKNESVSPMFPLDGLGSVLLGAWLLAMPEFFVDILMYILGAILLIAGLQQIITLISARKWKYVPMGYYVLPSIIFLVGLLILIYPMAVIANTLVIFGIAILFYGVNEIINWYKFRKQDYIQLD